MAEYKLLESKCSYPYVCSLTPQCRAAAKLLGAESTMVRVAESIVEDVANMSEVANSLKTACIGGFGARRQVDIRAEANGPVVLKCFVGWNKKLNAWHVFVEGADENILGLLDPRTGAGVEPAVRSAAIEPHASRRPGAIWKMPWPTSYRPEASVALGSRPTSSWAGQGIAVVVAGSCSPR